MGKAWVLFVCLALGVTACTEESRPVAPEAGTRSSPAGGGWVSFSHPAQPWSWHHPRGWHVETFDEDVGLATHEGAILSNVAHRFRHPDLKDSSTSAWDFSRVPSHAVVVELAQVVRLVMNCRDTTETPVSLADAEVYRGEHGSPPRRYKSLCVRGQPHFGLNVWFGEDASPEDEAAARKVVRSIRFRERAAAVDGSGRRLVRLPRVPGPHREVAARRGSAGLRLTAVSPRLRPRSSR